MEVPKYKNSEGKITLVQWDPDELQDTVPCMQGLFRELVERAKNAVVPAPKQNNPFDNIRNVQI